MQYQHPKISVILLLLFVSLLGYSHSFAFPNLSEARLIKSNKPFKWKESHRGLDCITELIRTFNLGDSFKRQRDTTETIVVEEGITNTLHVATLLLEYFQWPAQQRRDILRCNLNMNGP